jgi:hypothetical protein
MNVLIERKEIAQALNFGKYPVLTFDIDKNEGSKARVIKNSQRYGDMAYKCVLYRGKQTKDDGVFYLLTEPSVLSSTVSVRDYLECAEFANAPIIPPDTEVAILVYSKELNVCSLHIMKSGKVDPTYSTATVFS